MKHPRHISKPEHAARFLAGAAVSLLLTIPVVLKLLSEETPPAVLKAINPEKRQVDMTPAKFNIALGREIRKERMLRGWSMRFIADKMGYAYQQQHRYETGENGFSAFLLAKIAVFLGLTVAELYRRARVTAPSATPTPAEDDAILVARYIARIDDKATRQILVDISRKYAFKGAAA